MGLPLQVRYCCKQVQLSKVTLQIGSFTFGVTIWLLSIIVRDFDPLNCDHLARKFNTMSRCQLRNS